MKAVIIAAGNGTRLEPLTLTTPKILIPVLNRTVMEYLVDAVVDLCDEIVLVIGNPEKRPLQRQIIDFVESREWPLKINFAIQETQDGTAHALNMAKEFIGEGEKFLLLNGDDIYSREDIENLLGNEYGLLGLPVEDPEKWGVLQVKEDGCLKEIIEKPKEDVGNLANIGAYLLPFDIFYYFGNIKKSVRGELEVVDALSMIAEKMDIKVVKSSGLWLPIGYPWHLLDACQKLLHTADFEIEGEIEEGVVIDGRVKLGKNSIIKAGTRIEGDVLIGENCVIGPGAYIRGLTVIGDNCKIGFSVEVKNSVVMNGSQIPHLSYLGDGVLGKNVNFACGSKTANLRHDNENVQTTVKGQLVDTGLRKFSTVIGDNAKLGIDTLIYPGRKIWPNLGTAPGQVVDRDIVE